MDIVTIDFETYWDKKFSLAKMTTEEYVRSADFQVIGVGIKINNKPTDWYSGEDVEGFLKSIDYTDKAILAHNTYFDGAILSWLYGIKPKFWFDTMSMSKPKHMMTEGASLKALADYYGIGQKGAEVENTVGKRREDFTEDEMNNFGDYCIQDVELTYKLFNKLRQGFPPHELMVIDQTLRMYTEPTVVLDTDALEQHIVGVKQTKKALIDSLSMSQFSDAQLKKVLMSNDMFAKLLIALGVEPPTKTSLRTGKIAFAFAKTDKAFLNLLEHAVPQVRNLIKARLGTKSTIEETRTQRLIETSKRGYLPIMLKYYGAHTGRFSGGDKLNLQNLPRNGAIRRALTVPLGYKMIACDSSQIEARMTAYVSGQEDLLDAFREGRDVYSEFASDVYGIT
jgi:DNA polymerase